jgi:hypothetical protein
MIIGLAEVALHKSTQRCFLFSVIQGSQKMIKRVTETTLLNQAFYRVFRSTDPFAPAGRLEMPIRIVLYPTYGYHLNADQFQALADTLSDCGEPDFFMSLIEVEPDPFATEYNWVCEVPSLSEYMDLPLPAENGLYSMNGLWGILVSHEDHALLVCHSLFWHAFQQRYPNWKQDQEKFIQAWYRNEKELGSDVQWLREFLAHLSQSVIQ